MDQAQKKTNKWAKLLVIVGSTNSLSKSTCYIALLEEEAAWMEIEMKLAEAVEKSIIGKPSLEHE
ncbi:Hypothetical predicted protein [Olea europaea subsp. europaea]|uniref:Uncharacterized protein n=1 Tax=Olea europaea subsp. europaea TaxID=158383 RepID=A0A8S0UZG3_OLEEU|nr:Hypothetical predicted protein [Olea europaea subsp. europaea]